MVEILSFHSVLSVPYINEYACCFYTVFYDICFC